MFKLTLQTIILLFSWLYAVGIATWFIAKSMYGDTIWWLALLNVLAPQMFLPLPILFVIGLFQRKRKWYLVLLLPGVIFIWLYGNLFLPSMPASPTDQSGFTVMTFNVWGNSTSDELVQVIREQGSPDIVALQELRTPLAKILAEQLTDTYPYQALRTSYTSNGVGVLSKYPLTPKRMGNSHLFFLNYEFQVVEVQADQEIITLYNLHPSSTNIFQMWQLGGDIAYQIELSFRLRDFILQQVAERISAEQGPIIVTGDFNITDQNDAYALFSDFLNDAHREAGCGFGHTFPAYSGNFNNLPIPSRQLRIDMVWYSNHLIATESRVGNTSGESDHLPVIATLKWRR